MAMILCVNMFNNTELRALHQAHTKIAVYVHGCTASAVSKLGPFPKVISWLCSAGHSCCHGSSVRVCKPRQKPKHLQPGLQHQVDVVTRMGQIRRPEKRVLHLPHQGLCELTAVVCSLRWQICQTYGYCQMWTYSLFKICTGSIA